MDLQTAILSDKYEEVKALLADTANLGVEPVKLGVWERVQKDKLPGKDEEGNETEPKDVASEEYMTELSTELLPDVDPADAAFIIKAIVSIGLYEGGRASVEEYDKAFDTQVGDRSGFGVSLMASGDVYAGEYGVGGAREGKGALKTKGGTVYVGSWKEGKRHGMGSMTYADKGVYVGAWEYGKRHGKGTFTYPNGDVYVGSWCGGVKQGLGKYTATEAKAVYEGAWKNGTLVASKCTFQSAAGAAYYGQFDKAGRPTGAGAFAFGNGVSVSGTYEAAPLEEAEEGGEAPPVTPAVWKGAECGSVGPMTDGELKESLASASPTLNVVISGAPASGKGTQCEKIVEKLGLVHLSTGDMLRAAAEDEGNELGQIAKGHMEAGELVPDDLITGLVAQALSTPECKEKGWLLDGFPRTAEQANAMKKHFLIPNKCVLLDVPFDVLTERVTGRRLDPETGTIYHMKTKLPYKLDEEGNVLKEPVTEDDGEGGQKPVFEEDGETPKMQVRAHEPRPPRSPRRTPRRSPRRSPRPLRTPRIVLSTASTRLAPVRSGRRARSASPRVSVLGAALARTAGRARSGRDGTPDAARRRHRGGTRQASRVLLC